MQNGAAAAIREDGSVVSREEWAHDVRAVAAALAASGERRPLLACEDAYAFAVGFMAAAWVGLPIVIPANLRPTTLSAAQPGFNILTDAEIAAMRTAGFVPAAPAEGIREVTICTSGSTGEPVAVRKPLAAFEAEIVALQRRFGERVHGGLFASSIAHYHTYGLLFRLLWPLWTGGTLRVERVAHPSELRGCDAPINLISAPAFLSRYAGAAERAEDYRNWRFVSSSGAALPAEAARRWAELLPFPVNEFYGSTETGGVGLRQWPEGRIWTCLDGVEIERDANGRLLVRSLYTGRTSWLETADAADIIDARRFILKGRTDNIVKIHEKRVSLTHMEMHCTQSPWLAATRIFQLSADQRPVCVAVLSVEGKAALTREGRRVVTQRLRAHLHTAFDLTILPKKWRFVENFPYNEMGKIRHEDMSALFENCDE
jgi:acyl-coenzyme A synthetase/AMP-(fatty) acid ligase